VIKDRYQAFNNFEKTEKWDRIKKKMWLWKLYTGKNKKVHEIIVPR